MNRWFRLVAPVALAGLLVGVAATPAHAQTIIDHGHVDVFDIDYVAGTDSLDVNVFADNDTNFPGLHDPSAVRIGVEKTFTVPNGLNICATGTAWWLPQALMQSELDDYVFAGYNTHDVADGTVTGDQVTVNLVSVTYPSPFTSGFCVFTSSGSGIQMLLDGDGSPGLFTIPSDTHAHVNWVFDNPGTYRVTVNITAGGTNPTGNQIFTFVVS